jgi:hypothetical protein
VSDVNAFGSVSFDPSLGPPATFEDFAGGIYDQTAVDLLTNFVSASLTWAGGTFVPTPLVAPPAVTTVGDGFRLTNMTFGQPDELFLADESIWEDFHGPGEASSLRFFFEDLFIDDASPPTGTEFPNDTERSRRRSSALS